MNHLLCFGLGYSARALVAKFDKTAWKISATARSPEGIAEIESHGIRGLLFDSTLRIAPDVTHILISVPPDETGDPALKLFAEELRHSKHLTWVGYLSTTGVYGDRGGDWVDEDSLLEPDTARGQKRLEAERGWMRLHAALQVPGLRRHARCRPDGAGSFGVAAAIECP